MACQPARVMERTQLEKQVETKRHCGNGVTVTTELGFAVPKESEKKLISQSASHVINKASLSELEKFSRRTQIQPSARKLAIISTGVRNTLGILWTDWLRKGDSVFEGYSSNLKAAISAAHATVEKASNDLQGDEQTYAKTLGSKLAEYREFVKTLTDTNKSISDRKKDIKALHQGMSVAK